jgi:hypothetical protein
MVGEVDSWLNAVELKELFRSGHFCCEEGCEKWLFERENERDNIHCIPPPKKKPPTKKKSPSFCVPTTFNGTVVWSYHFHFFLINCQMVSIEGQIIYLIHIN